MNKKFTVLRILILCICIVSTDTQPYINAQQLHSEHEEQHTKDEEEEGNPKDKIDENPEEENENDDETNEIIDIAVDNEEDGEAMENTDDNEEDEETMEEVEDIEITDESSVITEEELSEELLNPVLFSDEVLFSSPNTASNYEELKNLIEDAPQGLETPIYISSDIELESTLEINSDKNIILRDNGGNYEISIHQGNFSGKGMFHVYSGGTLTIEENGGSLIFDGFGISTTARSGYFVTCEGTFNFISGTFQNATLKSTYTAAVLVNTSEDNAVFNMSGGTIKDSLINNPFSATVLLLSNAVFNMSGGEILNNRHEGSFYDQQISAGVYMMPYTKGQAVFNMSGGTIAGNNGFFGGGVFLYCSDSSRYAEFNMTGGIISDNEANYGGGGVFLLGNTVLNMENGYISKNKAPIGGGIGTLDTRTPVSGKFIMSGGTVSDNEANYGGGIYVASNDVLIQKGTIENNYAKQQGGGIYIGSPEYTMVLNDALITGNYADEGAAIGGGIWLCPTGTLHAGITGSVSILGNTASSGGNDVASELKEGPYYTLIPERTTGGSAAGWYQDAPGNRYSGTNEEEIALNTMNANEYYATVKYSPEAEKNAYNSYKVLITGNHSAKGGGIGTNGGITSGSNEFAEIKIIKQWQAEEGTIIPDEITVSLIIDGEIQPEEYILSADSDWTASITNLPLFSNTEDYYDIAELKIKGFDSQLDKSFDKDTNTLTIIIINTENNDAPQEPQEPEDPKEPAKPTPPDKEKPGRERPDREKSDKTTNEPKQPTKEAPEPKPEEPLIPLEPVPALPKPETPIPSEPKQEESCSQQEKAEEPEKIYKPEPSGNSEKNNPKTGGMLKNIIPAFTSSVLLSLWILIIFYRKNKGI